MRNRIICKKCGQLKPENYRRNFCICGGLYNDSNFLTTRDQLYYGDLLGDGTYIYGKDHWKKELKKRGLTDNFHSVLSLGKKPEEMDTYKMKKERNEMVTNAVSKAKRKIREEDKITINSM